VTEAQEEGRVGRNIARIWQTLRPYAKSAGETVRAMAGVVGVLVVPPVGIAWGAYAAGAAFGWLGVVGAVAGGGYLYALGIAWLKDYGDRGLPSLPQSYWTGRDGEILTRPGSSERGDRFHLS
jgi:hypothetical protein